VQSWPGGLIGDRGICQEITQWKALSGVGSVPRPIAVRSKFLPGLRVNNHTSATFRRQPPLVRRNGGQSMIDWRAVTAFGLTLSAMAFMGAIIVGLM
jgi:hypothetical protein